AGASVGNYLWTRLGDAEGKTLFVSTADTVSGLSSCVDTCAKDFPAVIAAPEAFGFGDWSVVKRPDGARQSAYQGKPLYTFAQEQKFNQVVETLLRDEQTAGPRRRNRNGDQPDALRPPEGWTVARFSPQQNLTLPGRLISVQRVAVQNGMGETLAT